MQRRRAGLPWHDWNVPCFYNWALATNNRLDDNRSRRQLVPKEDVHSAPNGSCLHRFQQPRISVHFSVSFSLQGMYSISLFIILNAKIFLIIWLKKNEKILI